MNTCLRGSVDHTLGAELVLYSMGYDDLTTAAGPTLEHNDNAVLL